MADAAGSVRFSFAVNKSLKDNGLLTVPAKAVSELRTFGLGEGAEALISYRGSESNTGALRTGWRAGGRYYQVAVRAGVVRELLANLPIGHKLSVGIRKADDNWIVDLA